jgi:cytochrome oxidase assembly protein ShyY1
VQRSAVARRVAALTVTAIAAVTVLVALGVWQWERSRPLAAPDSGRTVPVTEVVPDRGRILTADQGRRVSVTGTWRPDRRLLVADRARPDGDRAPGRWVVTAVELDPAAGGEPARLLPVVRGWIPARPGDPAATVPAPPSGSPASIEGWVQASEPLDTPVEVVQPDGVVALLAAADLVNRWPEDVGDGFVILDARSASRTALVGVESPLPGPVQAARGSRDWRNVAYAAQWWVFAAFAVVLWWRWVRDTWGDAGPGAERGRAAEEVTG